MASLHELRDLLKEGDKFPSFDDVLEVIRDASIKHKFSFKTLIKTSNAPDIIATINTVRRRLQLT
jgi:hypothetical protein